MLRMAKRRDVCTILLVMLVFIAVCLHSKAQAAAPSPPDTANAEPALIDPNETTPVIPEPNQADPNQTAPVIPEPNQVDPNEAAAVIPEPNQTDPNQTTQVVPEPNQTEPNDLEPGKSDPGAADANDIVPLSIEPNDIDPNDISPVKTEPNDPNAAGSAASFHKKCAPILKTFVNANGTVNYNGLTRKKPNLKALLDEFNKLDPNVYESWSRENKIAFWINAYNIKMLDIIVNNYPIKPLSRFHSAIWGAKSVRHIQGKWTKFKLLVMDEAFTLLEIDKRFFRNEFDEPRVFFALTRASLSSPTLRNEPYSADMLDKQLDDQAKKFFSSPLAFRIDKKKGRVYLSALFQKTEYGKMFVTKYGIDRKFKGKEPETRAVLNFITNFVSEDVKSYLELGNYTVQFMGYKWTINDGS